MAPALLEVFPWEHINTTVSKKFLTEDYQEKLGKRGKEYLAGLQNYPISLYYIFMWQVLNPSHQSQLC